MAGAYLGVVYVRCSLWGRLLVLYSNIRLGCKCLARTNTLAQAYFSINDGKKLYNIGPRAKFVAHQSIKTLLFITFLKVYSHIRFPNQI
jgi:hypothetical protein